MDPVDTQQKLLQHRTNVSNCYSDHGPTVICVCGMQVDKVSYLQAMDSIPNHHIRRAELLLMQVLP